MSNQSGPDSADKGRARPDPGLSAVISERRNLVNLAYRLLGSLAEAEDAVRETYARWYAMSAQQQDAIEKPGGWLTTVISRIWLDLLRSARARRERYVGAWLPEPLPDPTEALVCGQANGDRSGRSHEHAQMSGRITRSCGRRVSGHGADCRVSTGRLTIADAANFPAVTPPAAWPPFPQARRPGSEAH